MESRGNEKEPNARAPLACLMMHLRGGALSNNSHRGGNVDSRLGSNCHALLHVLARGLFFIASSST